MPATELTSPQKAKTELRRNWGISYKTMNELQKIVGKATFQELVLDRLRHDKIVDLNIILSRLAAQPQEEIRTKLPNDRPVMIPMMDLLTRILTIDNYLEKLLATASFTSNEHAEGGVANPGRVGLKEYDVVLKCLGIRSFTRIVEWIATSANDKIDDLDVWETMSALKDSLLKSEQVGANDENKKKLKDIAKRLKENISKKDKKKKEWPNLRSLIDSQASRTQSAIEIVDQLIYCYQDLNAIKPVPTYVSSLASVLYQDSRYDVLNSNKEKYPWVGDALKFLKNEPNGEYTQFAELVDLATAALQYEIPVPIALSSDIWLLGSLYKKMNNDTFEEKDPFTAIIKKANNQFGRDIDPKENKCPYFLKITLKKNTAKSSPPTISIVLCSEVLKSSPPSFSKEVNVYVYPIKLREEIRESKILVKVEGKRSELRSNLPLGLKAGDIIRLTENGRSTKEYTFYGIDSDGRVVAVDAVKSSTLWFFNKNSRLYLKTLPELSKDITIEKVKERGSNKIPLKLPLDGLKEQIINQNGGKSVEYAIKLFPPKVGTEFSKLTDRKLKGEHAVKEYIAKVKSYGFSSYIVGGGVRDILLDKKVNDVDLATMMPVVEVYETILKNELGRKSSPFEKADGNEQPPKVKKNIPMGIVKVDPDNVNGIDIVTFHDGMNKPGSRIISGSGFIYDTLSRDFTFNAIYYDNIEKKLIDATGCGLKDLGFRFKNDKWVGGAPNSGSQDLAFTEVKLRFVCCALAQVWQEKTEDTVSAKYKDALSRHLTNFPVDMARWIKFLSKNKSWERNIKNSLVGFARWIFCLSKNKPENRIRYLPYSRTDLSVIAQCLKIFADKTDDKSKYNKQRFVARMGCSTNEAKAVFKKGGGKYNVEAFFSLKEQTDPELIEASRKSIEESLELIFTSLERIF